MRFDIPWHQPIGNVCSFLQLLDDFRCVNVALLEFHWHDHESVVASVKENEIALRFHRSIRWEGKIDI